MEVYAVIGYWMMVVTPTEAGAKGLGALVQDLAAYFYTDNGLVALPRPERSQRLFDVLIDLFRKVKI